MGLDPKDKPPCRTMEDVIAQQEALMPQEAKAGAEFDATVYTSAAIAETVTANFGMEAVIGQVPPEFHAHYGMWLEVRDETDRGAAILAAAYLDDRLADALMSVFCQPGRTAKQLLKPNGFLGSYAAKCQIAYCLGLYGKTVLQTLYAIGEIRNAFAHSKRTLSFNDQKIITLCNNIRNVGEPFFDINPCNPYRNVYMNAAQCIGLILAVEMTRDDQPRRLPPRAAD